MHQQRTGIARTCPNSTTPIFFLVSSPLPSVIQVLWAFVPHFSLSLLKAREERTLSETLSDLAFVNQNLFNGEENKLPCNITHYLFLALSKDE